MQKIEIKDPQKQSNTGAYSSAVEYGDLVFVSGQGPLDMKTGAIVAGSVEEETTLTLQNIERVLRAAGCSRNDIVKCGCYLADINDFDAFDRAYAAFFGSGVRPARTTIGCGLIGIKVEIDAIAARPRAEVAS